MDKLSKPQSIQITNTLLIIFFCSNWLMLFAQNAATNSGEQIEQVQPTIIAIPFKERGKNYRDIIEHPRTGFEVRAALNAVDNAFKSRGFNTYDFIALFEKIQTMNAFSNGVQIDEQTVIIENSAADIYVIVDSKVTPDASGANVATINLKAYEAATGKILAPSEPGKSPPNHTNQIDKLFTRAIDNIKEDFLNKLQSSFNDIVINGRQIGVSFRVDPTSSINLDSEINNEGFLLSEVINDWLRKNAFKGYATPSGGSNAINVNYNVKIPLKNQATGQNYLPNDFGTLIRVFLRKDLKIQSRISSPQLGQLLVTIIGPIKN